MSQLRVLDKLSDIDELERYLSDKKLFAYDTETTGVHHGAEVVGISFCAEEAVAFYVIIWAWDKEQGKLAEVIPKERIVSLLLSLTGKGFICHNALFDANVTENYFGVPIIDDVHTCTLVLAQLLNENRKNGLKELGKHYFGEDAAKEQTLMKASVIENGGVWQEGKGGNKEMFKADPYLLGEYGAKDALLTFRLFFKLLDDLVEQGLEQFFYDDESMPLLRGPSYELNTTGLKVDQKALLTLKQTLKAECAEGKASVYREIDHLIKEKYPATNKKNTFNIESNQQLAWLLFGKMELEFGTLTKEGKVVCRALGMNKLPYTMSAKREFISLCLQHVGSVYSPEGYVNGKKVRAKKVKEPWAYIAADKMTLARFAKQYTWIETLLSYRKKLKLLTTYVEGIEERMQYGVIRPSFLQHGTTSGRYASRDPNFQNLPRDDKRVKGCIVPRPGKVFVGADYSQLEPRVFAYFSGDERLIAAFNGSDDFYSVIGIETWDKYDAVPLKEGPENAFGVKYKALRNAAKVIALAATYGATARQLAITTGKSIQETEEIIERYFEKFPNVKKFQLESHTLAKKVGYVTNLFGRKRRIPDAKRIPLSIQHDQLDYQHRKLLNLAINHRIQSTGASIVNRAAIAFTNNRKAAGIDAKLVLQVHDSLIVECDAQDAENIILLLQDAMENSVTLPGVPLEAEPKAGDSLAEV